MSVKNSDVVAAEVHRQALLNVAKEMSITLVRTSGSPVVVESQDFSTCLMDTVPEHLCFLAHAVIHLGSSLVGTQSIVGVVNEDEVVPGAGWVVNDPHTGGALHQGDVSIIMPTFYKDEHIGWSFVNTHVLDIGGSGISGFAPGATDVWQEGLLFPPIRIIRDGAIEPEWSRFIAANVRAPGPVLNDMRSMIAANNAASRKLAEVVEDFGLDAHRELSELNKDLTEELLRERISAIPDGIYPSTDWQELRRPGVSDELLELNLELEVDGSDLHFRFDGPPQVTTFVNATPGVVTGWTAGEVMRVLGYGDLPMNGGLWRPLDIDLGAPGTLFNSLPPAPVSCGHGALGCRTSQLVRHALTAAVALSERPKLRQRVAGRCVDAFPAACWFGENQHGNPGVMFYVDGAVGIGGPAQTTGDGQDIFGLGEAMGARMSDVETHEALDPVLFLWRRLVPDSAGIGEHRGGLGMEQAYALHFSQVAMGPVFHTGTEIPASGTGGGCPAPPGDHFLLRDTNVGELIDAGTMPTHERFSGRQEDLQGLNPQVVIYNGDVYVQTCGGGSGLGDALLRSPQSVARDVADGYVTAAQARAGYGVVLGDDLTVDAHATALCREDLRRARIDAEPDRVLEAPKSRGISVVLGDEGTVWACGHCGHALAAASENWRTGDVASRSTPAWSRLAELGQEVRRRQESPEVVVVEHACRACAGMLSVDVTTDALPPQPAPELLSARLASASR
jgi:N-methylhydantoinase B